MSAIRDCDDDLRRTNILDRMITYAFHESRESLALGVPPAQRALDNVPAVLDAAAVTLHRSPRA